ncbi:MAG: hypothetical protein HY078_00525 [Elusimicrobia bacterium]|nr:hypothetical protein [Elusimicrobiota bacterium]
MRKKYQRSKRIPLGFAMDGVPEHGLLKKERLIQRFGKKLYRGNLLRTFDADAYLS